MRTAGIGALLTAVMLAGAGIAVAGSGDTGTGAGARIVHVRIHYSRFYPEAIDVEPGQTVRFVVENTDPFDH
jgi:plastocyanin